MRGGLRRDEQSDRKAYGGRHRQPMAQEAVLGACAWYRRGEFRTGKADEAEITAASPHSMQRSGGFPTAMLAMWPPTATRRQASSWAVRWPVRRRGSSQIYAAGNFSEATDRAPFLQAGETKFGKPILEWALRFETSLKRLRPERIAIFCHKGREIGGVSPPRFTPPISYVSMI